MQLSKLIGKPVLTRAGDRLGYVVAARPTRDMKKLSCLICADAEEETFILPMRAVLAAEDAVIAGNARADAPTGVPCPIGKHAYASTGESLGRLCDVEIGETPVFFIQGEREIRCEADRVALGENAIVYPTAAERRPIPAQRKSAPRPAKRRAPTQAQAQNEDTVSAPTAQKPPETPIAHETSAAPLPSAQPQPSAAPQEGYRIDRTNLLGRRVKKSVYDAAGNPVALAGERITPETIARARRKNRLLALTVNTLTNIL